VRRDSPPTFSNLRDRVILDEVDVEIHLMKEDVALSRESKSSERIVHRIKVLTAFHQPFDLIV
jgi:site-specific DNA recombinase